MILTNNLSIRDDERKFKNFRGRFPYISKNGSKIMMRSSWEVLYAQYLDDNEIKWYYEPMSFRSIDNSFYHPDFYLPGEDVWVEIKGFLRNRSKQKIEAFQQRYPGKLKVLFKEDLEQLNVL